MRAGQGGVSEGVWKGGGEDLWETWDGEGRREKGEGRMYDLEDCVNVVRERFVLEHLSGGEGHDARLYGTITHTPLRSLIVFSGGAAIVARVLTYCMINWMLLLSVVISGYLCLQWEISDFPSEVFL